MGRARTVTVTDEQRRDLQRLVAHAPKAYLRERAAAILKVAQGMPAAQVGAHGLLRRHAPDTLYAWLDRFEAEGIAGLTMRAGRGRKPAFSPSARRRGAGGAPGHRAARAAPVGGEANALDPGGALGGRA
ncbi:MAG TPA: helix-turn-helix domain-containing protein [Ktedonobacterales bacterium]|nr:helix-turn-helix domain-containing protein [Ktedonobacterales bacterium]